MSLIIHVLTTLGEFFLFYFILIFKCFLCENLRKTASLGGISSSAAAKMFVLHVMKAICKPLFTAFPGIMAFNVRECEEATAGKFRQDLHLQRESM